MKTTALLTLAAAALPAAGPLAPAHHHRRTPSPRRWFGRWRAVRTVGVLLALAGLLGATGPARAASFSGSGTTFTVALSGDTLTNKEANPSR
jgi:hypothetical protein